MALNLGGGSMTSNFNSLYLGQAQTMLNQSLMRLSSGKRINRPSDDPGGLAVSMRLQNALTVTSATKQNIDNAKSYTDTQDAALKSVGDILTRMSTIKTSYGDNGSGLNTTDKANYASEFRELQAQLNAFKSEKFSSISLFSTQGISRNVYISTQGSTGASISVGSLDLSSALSIASGVNLSSERYGANAISISDVTSTQLNTALSNVASLRAQSGATSSRLDFSSDYLSTSMIHLEEANSRIMDVDVAEETTNMAKYNLQVYAASAALVQSNLNMGIVLDLLNFNSNSRR
ncbi:flagellin [Opitutales bacterium]|nr:flagellin [Opitutales bacterium]